MQKFIRYKNIRYKIYSISTKFIQVKNYLHCISNISRIFEGETDQLNWNTKIGIRKLGSAINWYISAYNFPYELHCASTYKIYIYYQNVVTIIIILRKKWVLSNTIIRNGWNDWFRITKSFHTFTKNWRNFVVFTSKMFSI